MVEREICPRCGKEAIVKNTWVRNSSKKVYYYKIYIHEFSKHYVNTSIENYKTERSKRDEVYSIVLNRISMTDYFNRKFSVRELFDDLKLTYPDIHYSNLRRVLFKLSEDEIITKTNEHRKIFFSISQRVIGRLYKMSDMKIVLDQDTAKNIYTRGVEVSFKNITIFPLRFYFLVIHFDSPTNRDQVRFSVSDILNNTPLKVSDRIIDEMTMFIYINFDQPLYPGQEKSIKFIYEAVGSPNNFYFSATYEIDQLSICLNAKYIKNVDFYHLLKGETKPIPIQKSLIKTVELDDKVMYCYKSNYTTTSLIQINWS